MNSRTVSAGASITIDLPFLVRQIARSPECKIVSRHEEVSELQLASAKTPSANVNNDRCFIDFQCAVNFEVPPDHKDTNALLGEQRKMRVL